MQEISSSPESIESKREMVGEWIKNIGEQQKVEEIPAEILRDVLTSYGANFENLSDEVKNSLARYREIYRGFGVRNVWGDDFVNGYKAKVSDFIKEYESDTGIELPILEHKSDSNKSTKRKNSGMIQFLFDLTSFASGKYDFETYKTITEARIQNGLIHQEYQKEKKANNGVDLPDKPEKVRVEVPDEKKPIVLSSVPPELPVKAWEWISTKK